MNLIHIFERRGFLYDSFLLGNTKKTPKTTQKRKKPKEKRKAQSDSERVK